MRQNNDTSIIELIIIPILAICGFAWTCHQETQFNLRFYNSPYRVDVDQEVASAVRAVNLAAERVVVKKHLPSGAPIRFQELLHELPNHCSEYIKFLNQNMYLFHSECPARFAFIIVLDKAPLKGESFAVGFRDRFIPAPPKKGSALGSFADRFYDAFPKDSSQSRVIP